MKVNENIALGRQAIRVGGGLLGPQHNALSASLIVVARKKKLTMKANYMKLNLQLLMSLETGYMTVT